MIRQSKPIPSKGFSFPEKKKAAKRSVEQISDRKKRRWLTGWLVEYITDSNFNSKQLGHLCRIAQYVNHSKESEIEIINFVNQIEKKYSPF